jgi:hypothetical protein
LGGSWRWNCFDVLNHQRENHFSASLEICAKALGNLSKLIFIFIFLNHKNHQSAALDHRQNQMIVDIYHLSNNFPAPQPPSAPIPEPMSPPINVPSPGQITVPITAPLKLPNPPVAALITPFPSPFEAA